MSMNVIELTEAPVVEKVPEGATCFCLNPDGSVNRFKLDSLNQVEEVIFYVKLPSTVDASAGDGESAAPTVTCDKTPSEIRTLLESGRKVDYRCSLSTDDGFNERASSLAVILDSSVNSKTRANLSPFLSVGFISFYEMTSFYLAVFENRIEYIPVGA